ncbi:MAG: MBL fold metallo-hydrolase [Candidatus Micrarchaeia archaeon]
MEFDFVKWIDHAGFLIEADGIEIYIDPFRIREPEKLAKADLIFVTHSHYDHLSPRDIAAISKRETQIIAPKEAKSKLSGNVLAVEPNKSYSAKGISFETIPAYNIKPERLNFHPRSNGWVGYILEVANKRIYHAGDTDFVEEMKKVKADLALLPVGGTYTMNVEEAVEAARSMASVGAFAPMHYKALLGQSGYVKAEEAFKKEIRNSLILKQIQEPFFSL